MEASDRELTGLEAIEWMIAHKGEFMETRDNVRVQFDGMSIVLWHFVGDVGASWRISLQDALKMTFRHLKPTIPTKTQPPDGCSWYQHAACPASSIYLSDSSRSSRIEVPRDEAGRKRLREMTEVCIAASLEVYG